MHEGLDVNKVNMFDHRMAITFTLSAYGDVEEEWTKGDVLQAQPLAKKNIETMKFRTP